jgi:hypothetical protein
MTDRELLEAAAKAAGYTGQWDANWYAMCDGENYWDPLRHNGQAFRLAVSMCLTVKVNSHEVEVFDQDGCLVSIPIFRASRFVDADNWPQRSQAVDAVHPTAGKEPAPLTHPGPTPHSRLAAQESNLPRHQPGPALPDT